MANWRRILGGILAFAALLYIGYSLLPRVLLGLRKSELALTDLRFRMRPPLAPDPNIVIVDIDEASISELENWPWPRSFYGRIINVLQKRGAKVIGFDILFDSKSSLGVQEDILFSRALQNYPHAVLASRRHGEEEKGFALSGWSLPIGILRDYSDYGFVNEILDPDGAIRRSWLFLSENEKAMQFSWDIAVLAHYLAIFPGEIKADETNQKISLGDLAVPYSTPGFFTINYFGGPKTFKHIPFYLVLQDRFADKSAFKNKIVLIGATDPILHDFYETPFGEMSGVEIHANALSTLLQKRFVTVSPIALDIACVLLLCALIIFASLRFRALLGLVCATLLLFSYSAAAVIGFSKWNYLLVWSYPLFFGLTSYFVVVIAKFIREEKEKRKIKGMFQQYVSPGVVEELIKDPSKLRLGGEKRKITVFFSDIRSFTTYSEKHSPEQVVEILNEYLDAMTLCIFKWKGTLDKYVGDEIMAVWGAPIYVENHAELALRCCWDQLKILRELQAKWRAEGRDAVDIGMGLNTGEMIVGNIGSSVHKDYTVIGDAVNLGARLESETRHHGSPEKPCYLIISQFTYELVKNICKVNALGGVTVKGKTIPVQIYEVIDVDMGI